MRHVLLAGVAGLALLTGAATAAPEISSDAPVLFEADRLSYDMNGRTIRLTGGVELASDGRTLSAQEVAYDQATGRVTASGGVTIREADGSTLTADSVELTGDLRDGVIENVAVFLDEYARLAARRGVREGGERASLESAVFSPCRICVESGQTEALWQIKAARVVWDQSEKRMFYEDASFDVFGTTIITVPSFSHADFTVRNQTGFLAPTAGSSSDLGYFVEVPFHWAIAPSYDLTVAAMVTTDVNPILKAQWRERTQTGYYNFSGSFTYDDEFDSAGDPTGGRTSYGHIFGRGRFQLGETQGWGFDLERASSDTYLERYQISDADRLTSRAYWFWRADRSYAIVSAYAFQGLRASDVDGLTPLVLPEAQLHYVLDDAFWGGEVAIDASALALTRSAGLDTRRLSSSVSWSRPEILPGGQAITLFATLRGDLYHLGDVDRSIYSNLKSDELLARVTGYVGADMRWPFVRQGSGGSTQIIEPIAQVILAPYGSGPDGIPNEDSQSLEFDDTNLFNPVKFTGLDLVETGPRANVGLRYAEYFPGGASIEALAGFQVRLDDDPAFRTASGLGETQSDYVSRVSFTPWDGLTITNRLRLDKDDFSVRRNEIYVQGSASIFEVDAAYLKLESDPQITGLGPREEISLRSRVHVTEYWSFIGGFRRDLEDDKMIESRFAVAYEDECAFLELGLRRRFTRDRDAEPSTTVIFSVRLKAMGDDETARPLYQRDPYLGHESRDPRDFGSF